MKVLHVLNTRRFSGAENVVCQIISLFSKDNSIEMAYCSPEGQICEALKERNIEFISLGKKLNKKRLKKVLETYRPDIIHAHDMRASYIASCVCGKIPLISHIHNNNFNSRGLSLKSFAYLKAGFKAKHIFWVSKSSYEGYSFHNLLKKKSEILYNIIDVDDLYRRVDLDKNSYNYDVIFVGRLTLQKNPMRFLDICAKLVKQKPNIKIVVVGTGDMEKEVLAKAKDLCLNNNVDFLGFISNPLKILKDSKIMVMTSLWEGTPMCALEAAALGTPIVSTPVDGLKDLVENDKNGFLSDNDEEIVSKTLGYISNDNLLNKMSLAQINKSRVWNDITLYKNNIKKVYAKINHN